MTFTFKTLLAAATLTLANSAIAIPFMSGDFNAGESCTSYLDTSCNLQIINAHPLWQPSSSTGGAQWVSISDSGQPGSDSIPNDSSTPYMTVTETFNFSVASFLSFDIWADDTAEVWLDGVSLFSPNKTQNICANGTIGCEPLEFEHFDWALSAGEHTISFDVYQIGGGPAGLLYTGTLSLIPEPGSLALFGLGLAGLGFARKRQSK